MEPTDFATKYDHTNKNSMHDAMGIGKLRYAVLENELARIIADVINRKLAPTVVLERIEEQTWSPAEKILMIFRYGETFGGLIESYKPKIDMEKIARTMAELIEEQTGGECVGVGIQGPDGIRFFNYDKEKKKADKGEGT